MIPADAIDRAKQSDILAVAQKLGARIKKVAANEYVGPCPICGGNDRFSVNVKKQVWNCRHCDDGGDVIKLMRHVRGATFAEAIVELAGEGWTPAKGPRRSIGEPNPKEKRTSHRRSAEGSQPSDAGPQDDDRNSRLTLGSWNAARSIRGTLAEHYLVRVRGIDIDQIIELDDVLRFEPNCPFGGERLSCLIALVRDIVTDTPKAIQRTALDADGRKIDRRSLGPTRGGAIKLWEDAEVTYGLVVGEGLETVAAAATRVEHRGTLLQPAWALIDRINLRDFPLLTAVEALTILVDHDESGDGQKAASVCARRWLDAKREVIRLTPKTLGTDFDDIVREEGA